MSILDIAALQALPEDEAPAGVDFIDVGCCSFTCGTNSCGATCPATTA
jgi:hypothetical protein